MDARIDSRIDPGYNSINANLYRVRAYHPDTHTVDLESANHHHTGHLVDVPILMNLGGTWEHQKRSGIVDVVDPEQWGKVDRGPRWGEWGWPEIGDTVLVVWMGGDQSQPIVIGHVLTRGDRVVSWSLEQIYRPRKNRYTQNLPEDLNRPRGGNVFPEGTVFTVGDKGSMVFSLPPVHNPHGFFSFNHENSIIDLWARKPGKEEEDKYRYRFQIDPEKEQILLQVHDSRLLITPEGIDLQSKSVRVDGREHIVNLESVDTPSLETVPYEISDPELAEVCAACMGDRILRGFLPEELGLNYEELIARDIPPTLAQRMVDAVQSIVAIDPNNIAQTLKQHLGSVALLAPQQLTTVLESVVNEVTNEVTNILETDVLGYLRGACSGAGFTPEQTEQILGFAGREILGEIGESLSDATVLALEQIQDLPDQVRWVMRTQPPEIIARIPELVNTITAETRDAMRAALTQWQRVLAASDGLPELPEILEPLEQIGVPASGCSGSVIGELGSLAESAREQLAAIPAEVFPDIAENCPDIPQLLDNLKSFEDGCFRWMTPRMVRTNRPIRDEVTRREPADPEMRQYPGRPLNLCPPLLQTRGYNGKLSKWMQQ